MGSLLVGGAYGKETNRAGMMRKRKNISVWDGKHTAHLEFTFNILYVLY